MTQEMKDDQDNDTLSKPIWELIRFDNNCLNNLLSNDSFSKMTTVRKVEFLEKMINHAKDDIAFWANLMGDITKRIRPPARMVPVTQLVVSSGSQLMRCRTPDYMEYPKTLVNYFKGLHLDFVPADAPLYDKGTISPEDNKHNFNIILEELTKIQSKYNNMENAKNKLEKLKQELKEQSDSQSKRLFECVEDENKYDDLVKLLDEPEIEVNVLNEKGATPLAKAASKVNLKAVILLLEKDADVNAYDPNHNPFISNNDDDGWPPLFYAITQAYYKPPDDLERSDELLKKSKEITKLLLKKEINCELLNHIHTLFIEIENESLKEIAEMASSNNFDTFCNFIIEEIKNRIYCADPVHYGDFLENTKQWASKYEFSSLVELITKKTKNTCTQNTVSSESTIKPPDSPERSLSCSSMSFFTSRKPAEPQPQVERKSIEENPEISDRQGTLLCNF